MTRLFLAAGVAALAIAAPATAGPHGGGKDRQAPAADRGGGGQRAQAAPRVQRGGGGGFAAPRMQRAPRMAAPQMQRAQRFAAIERPQRAQRQAPQVRMQARAERQQVRVNRTQAQNRMAQRQQVKTNRAQAQNRMAQQQQVRANRVQAQNRMAQRQQVRANPAQAQDRTAQRQDIRANRAQAQNRMAERQQVRMQRFQQIQSQVAQRQQLRGERIAQQTVVNTRMANGFGAGGCPPGLISKGCVPPGQALQQMRQMPLQDRIATLQSFGPTRFETLDFAPRRRFLSPLAANALLGMPLTTAATFGAFSPLPQSISYLYPATPNYYYQYGDGYVYQVDRTSSIISALIPLLAGGFMPGSYLPPAYMSSYVPNYYGLNSFYPASYGYGGYGGYGAGYGYDNLCNRYYNGVVYQVDCGTGFVVNVVPLYAGGYGVGQLLPSAYSYYNVPDQYRGLYYDTPDYGYWYAPGAIYQYDRGTSLITSVAALMSPGFSIGQPLPLGYGMYNVPLAYRATYYDTPNAWYRYNNGYIYQVDPTTQLVTAVVASLLT